METRPGRVQCRTCHHREAVRPQLKGAKLVNTSRGPNGSQFPSHQISLPNSRAAHHPFPWMLEHIFMMFTSHLLPGYACLLQDTITDFRRDVLHLLKLSLLGTTGYFMMPTLVRQRVVGGFKFRFVECERNQSLTRTNISWIKSRGWTGDHLT